MHDHQKVQDIVREFCCKLHGRGQIGRQRGRAVVPAHRQTNQGEDENDGAEPFMSRDEGQIFRGNGRDHSDADEQHGEDADRHQPVERTLQRLEPLSDGDHGVAPAAVCG